MWNSSGSNKVRNLLGALSGLVLLLSLSACETAQIEVRMPPRLVYQEAEALMDENLMQDAITKFKEVALQNTGTRLGSFAYLRLAEIYVGQREWEDAKTNYRLFLAQNNNSHLTPYVLFRLMKANHENSYTGTLFPEREIDRDMEPNLALIRNFKRFYFLYPQSRFIEESREYYRDAVKSLAAHEHMVGDYYFDRGLFNAAASRYAYLLRNFPRYPESRAVLGRLITAYRLDQQPERAEEMERIRKRLFSGLKKATPSLAQRDDARQ